MKLHKFRPIELDKLVSESVKKILQPDLLQHHQNNIYLIPYIIYNMDTYLRMASMKLVQIKKIITNIKIRLYSYIYLDVTRINLISIRTYFIM